jgi:hypothetical protein
MAAPRYTIDVEHAGPKVTAGAYYEPRVLPDYGGAFFNLINNKLRQQDVRDPDDALIAPWNMYGALRPGTLIMAEVTLHAFHITDKKETGVERRVSPSRFARWCGVS